MFTPFPDARYEIKSFAADTVHNNVTAYAVFFASHMAATRRARPSSILAGNVTKINTARTTFDFQLDPIYFPRTEIARGI